jgi:hypothetical protein
VQPIHAVKKRKTYLLSDIYPIPTLKKLKIYRKEKIKTYDATTVRHSLLNKKKLSFMVLEVSSLLNYTKIFFTAQSLPSTLQACIVGSRCISQLKLRSSFLKDKKLGSKFGETIRSPKFGMNGL